MEVVNGTLVHQIDSLLFGTVLGDISRDGKWAAFILQDSSVRIYEIHTGRCAGTIGGQSAFVNSALFSQEGNSILVASHLGNIDYWRLENGKPREKSSLQTSHSRHLAFCPDGQSFISMSILGTVTIWDIKSRHPLVTCIDIGSGDWVFLHQSGLFDASANAMQKMHWLKAFEIIDFTQLKMRYWEPDLFEKIMGGKPLRDVQGMNMYLSAPEVEFDDIRDGYLPVRLKKRDGGYGKVSVYVNGKEVTDDAMVDQVLDENAPMHLLTIAIDQSPFIRPGVENTISIVPWSEDGSAQGRGAEILYKKEGEKDSSPPALYAIICGVSEYARPNIQLRYAEPDAQAISKAIRLGAEKLFGTDKTFIYTHTSPGPIPPTKENIRTSFQQIKETANPGDILILYLSGHGITLGNEDRDFYFLTAEAFDAQAETFTDPAIRQSTTISTREFTEWINEIPVLKQVMIIDACGSGKAVENLLASRNVESSQKIAIDRMKDRTGMFIISGCAADAVSYEASRYGQGLLTYSLLQAMKGAALREDKYVDVNLLFNYALETVPELAKGIGGIQEPQILLPRGGSFDIGILDETERANIQLANPKPVFIRSGFINIQESEDNLDLSKKLDEKLSTLSARGNQGSVVFIDAREYPEGCKASGTYYEAGSMWTITSKLKCGEKVWNFQITEQNEMDLVRLLTDKVIELSEQLY